MSSLLGSEFESTKTRESDYLNTLFTNQVVFNENWHNEFFFEFPDDNDSQKELGWRLKDRTKTSGAVLVVCLNIGTDPPDVVRPNPCARRECWIEPTLPKQKGLEAIGNALQAQYEKLQSKIKYKQLLDPTPEDLHKTCSSLRKTFKNDRLLFHYNGHGVPRPTKNGEIWLFAKHYSHYFPTPIHDIRGWLGDSVVYLLDCSAAGVLIPQLIDIHSALSMESNQLNQSKHGHNSNSMDLLNSLKSYSSQQLTHVMSGPQHVESPCIVLAACKADEILPLSPLYPADIFTCCLTTPISIALRWLIIQNPYSLSDVSLDLSEHLPGKESDRKTPRGELYWIFTAVTDTIAWSSLPLITFQKIYRQEMLVATLFRNFLLARRIMKSFSCTCQSWPILPDTSNHPLWQTWDLAAECCLLHVSNQLRGTMMIHPKNNMPFPGPASTSAEPSTVSPGSSANNMKISNIISPNLSFFTEQLTAFEIWLDYGNKSSEEIPIHLPILLQVLLSQTHRLRALILLKRYLATGSHAVSSILLVGIFPYILKLLQSSASDIRQVLVAIWAYIIGYDSSCRQDLLREKYQGYFIQFISMKEYSLSHRCLSMFILTVMCSDNKEGQSVCLQQGLNRSCVSLLSQPESLTCTPFIQWTCFCLAKLLEDVTWAKYLCITEAGHAQIYPLLGHEDPIIRATAAFTLGEVFGASNLTKLGSGFGSHMISSLSNVPLTPSLGLGIGLGGPGNGNVAQSASTTSTGTFSHGRSNSDMSISSMESIADPRELREAELQLALQILDSCTDGCVVVRFEALVALSKFVILPVHLPCFTIITKGLMKLKVIESPVKPRTSFTFAMPGTVPSSGTTNDNNVKTSSPALPNGLKTSGNNTNQIKNSTPEPQSVLNNSSDNSVNDEVVFPWNLNPMQTQVLIEELKTYLESQGIGLTPPVSPHPPMSIADPHNSGESLTVPVNHPVTPSGEQLSSMMAAAYVRFWLAIYEVQSKDPHIYVAKAASELCERVMDQVQYENARQEWESSRNGPGYDTNRIAPQSNSLWSFENTVPYQNPVMGPVSPSAALNQMNPGLVSPSGYIMSGRGNIGNGSLPRLEGFDSSVPSLLSGPTSAFQSLPSPGNRLATPRQQSFLYPPSMLGSHSLGNDDGVGNEPIVFAAPDPNPVWSPLSSSFYSWAKRLFLHPNESSDLIYDDCLTVEGNNVLFRQERQNLVRQMVSKLVETYKVLDDSQDYQIIDRKTKEEIQTQRSSAIASLPQALVKFEQKTILNIDNAKLTSLVMFHPFHDILATSDGNNVKIWSINNGNKIMEVFNTHNQMGSLASGFPSSSGSTASTVKSRITAMSWINESYETMLMIGTDNGNVNVWRDLSESYDPHQSFSKQLNIQDSPSQRGGLNCVNKIGISYDSHASSYASQGTNLMIASSFSALPDIADTNRGSGLVFSWIQEKGVLVVGGNSPTIRIWDLVAEQCTRVFTTGLDTCTTALASKHVASSFFSSQSLSSFLNNKNRISSASVDEDSLESSRLSWTFAGFADGTVSIFDERVQSNTKVHSARADVNAWIVAAYTRHDLPQVITASVKGTVRFFDIRNMRVYKTLEVFKHPLTALAVHRCVPLMATGSHAQVVKVFTMGGDQLDRDIKYHDGFLGQRIGPVSCLAFHPHKMMLASGATDNLVSIYAPADA